MTGKPSVLFVCVHNAGRSQMAAGWLCHLAIRQSLYKAQRCPRPNYCRRPLVELAPHR